MLTKTETVQTIWVGMSRDQQGDLIKVIDYFATGGRDELVSDNEKESLSQLRQALLNV